MAHDQNDELLEVCKALANPTRLQIMGWQQSVTDPTGRKYACSPLSTTFRHRSAERYDDPSAA